MTKTPDTVTPTRYHHDWSSDGTGPAPGPPPARPRPRNRSLAVLTVAILLAGGTAGLGGWFLVPPTYGARAEILYPITEELPTGFLREDRNLTTQLVFMRSRAVLAPAAEAEGMSLERLEEQVTVSLLDSSEIIQIEVRDRSPSAARRLVGHITRTYLELAQSSPESNALRYVESELAEVETALARAQERLGELRGQRASAGNRLSDQIDAVTADIGDLRTRAQALREERDEIQIIQRAAPNVELITQPYTLDGPVGPGPIVLGAAGALTGVVVASCVVALLVRRRMRA